MERIKKLSTTERRDGLVSWYNLDIFKHTKETLQLSGSVWIRFIWPDPDPDTDPFQTIWIRIQVDSPKGLFFVT